MNGETAKNIKVKLKSILKGFLIFVGIVAVVGLLVYITLSIYAGKKEKEALALWEKAGYPLEARYNDLSSTKENDCVRRIRTLAQKMRISSGPEGKQVCMVNDYKKVYDYVHKQLTSDKLELSLPDKETAERINSTRKGLDELCSILENSVPIWEYDKTNMNAASPDYLSVLNFERLLCADSLLSLFEGNKERAVRNMRFEIKLAKNLDTRHGILPALILIASYKYIIGSVRFFPDIPEDTVLEIGSIDPINVMKEGYVQEAVYAWKTFRVSSPLFENCGNKVENFIRTNVFAHYLRLCAANYLIFYLDFMRQIENTNPCDLSKIDITTSVVNSIPKWNIIGRIAMPNLQESWVRAYRLKLDKDLTLSIFKVRGEKIKTGRLPETIDLPPGICPGTSWKYVKDNNHFSIYFNGTFETKNRKGLILPLKWEERVE